MVLLDVMFCEKSCKDVWQMSACEYICGGGYKSTELVNGKTCLCDNILHAIDTG